MKDICFWTGPVSANQVANVKWARSTDVVTVGKDICPETGVCWNAMTQYAMGLPSGEGTSKLDSLIQRVGLEGPHVRRVLSGFSAGGAFLEGICSDKASRDQLDAVLSLDSWYFGGSPPGLLSYVDRAVESKGLMILTTSGDESYAFKTPEVQVKPLLAKIGVQDMIPKSVDLFFAGAPMPKPAVAQSKGQLMHFGWGKTLGHTDHAKLVGPWLLEHLVSPYLASLDQPQPPGPGPGPGPNPPAPSPQDGTSWLWWVLGGSAALAAGWYGANYALKRWRRK